MVLRLGIAVCLLWGGLACAQGLDYQDNVPLEEYLSALEQILPAARNGAEAYMSGYASNCGRAITTVELRRAVSERMGDPVLMGLIRAAYYKDAAQMQQLKSVVKCPSRLSRK